MPTKYLQDVSEEYLPNTEEELFLWEREVELGPAGVAEIGPSGEVPSNEKEWPGPRLRGGSWRWQGLAAVQVSVVMWRWMRSKAPELDLEGIYEELDKPQGRILGGGVPEWTQWEKSVPRGCSRQGVHSDRGQGCVSGMGWMERDESYVGGESGLGRGWLQKASWRLPFFLFLIQKRWEWCS